MPPPLAPRTKSLAPSSNPYIPYEDASMAHVDPADAAAVRIGGATRRNTICVSAGRCMRIMRVAPIERHSGDFDLNDLPKVVRRN